MITIPTVPPGVEDANDLNYGRFTPPLPWSDVELHDRIAWLTEEAAKADVILLATFYTPRGQDPVMGTEARLPVAVAFTDQQGRTADIQAHHIRRMDYVSTEILEKTFQFGHPNVSNTYPGLDVRYPPSGDPVGGPWPEMEKRWFRKAGTLFHPSPADGPAFAYGQTNAPFERPDGSRFVKHRWVIGSNGFSVQFGDVWEKV